MTKTRFLIAIIFCVFAGVGRLAAQDLPKLSGPVDLPPPSFAGNEYVDGRGCVFTRARIDGNVTWLPRTNAARQQVCGMAPTLTPTRLAKAPVATSGARGAAHPTVAPEPRVIARHVYDNRQNTLVAAVPHGYRSAWSDGRLNPHRTEMTLAPSVVHARANPPRGFTPGWGDGRLNPDRGTRTAAGDAQTDRIWTRTVPRTLRPVPTDVPVVRIERPRQQRDSVFWRPLLPDQPQVGIGVSVTRLSSRSEPSRFRPRADR